MFAVLAQLSENFIFIYLGLNLSVASVGLAERTVVAASIEPG